MTSKPAIADGMVVSLEYTLKTPDGDIIDTSDGHEPLVYLHGASNIVPGLEEELTGCVAGDQLSVVVPPEKGYGERSGPEPRSVPRSDFPDGEEIEAGMQIIAESQDGEQFPLWVVEVTDEDVVLDHNHPLAGVTLHFDVEVVAVRKATAEELDHEHPHGPDGHGHHH